MSDLSVLIPARNERWLSRTVADVCEHAKGDTEVIVVLDGAWPESGYELKQHPKVHVIYLPEPIGQRAATNLAARVSTARYVMKADAHCSFADGFDVALMDAARELGDDVVQIPAQRNLKVYNQVCVGCGAEFDQAPMRGPRGAKPELRTCPTCGSMEFRQSVVWKPRARPQTTNWVFNSELQFKYASDKKQTGDLPETMSCLGACWFLDRSWYWRFGGLDEAHGSWGQMGTELACKAWLSGGRMVTNRRTEYAHFFRVGGISFPYEIHHSDQEKAREYSRDLWRGNKWPHQKYPLRWLVERFWPVSGWTQEQLDALPKELNRDRGVPAAVEGDTLGRVVEPAHESGRDRRYSGGHRPSSGVVCYSDNRCPEPIASAVREQLEAVAPGPIVAVSLKPLAWRAAKNIVLPLERGPLAMFKQILAGLEALDTDVVFFAEHDVLYHPSHFDFTPEPDRYYYNLNWWKVCSQTGRAVTYQAKQTSQLCASRELLIAHYRKRVKIVERNGFTRRMGFEPGSHRRPERVDDVPSDTWRSPLPNIDIRHTANMTQSRWSPEQFRDQRNCQGWAEADEIPGWGVTRGQFMDFLMEAVRGQQAVA